MTIEPTINALMELLVASEVKAPVWDTEYGPNDPSNIATDQQRLWLFNSLIVRMQSGLDGAIWYQWDNQTHGACCDLDGNLTTFGNAWVDFYNAQQAQTDSTQMEQFKEEIFKAWVECRDTFK
jgi:hypothetical protein